MGDISYVIDVMISQMLPNEAIIFNDKSPSMSSEVICDDLHYKHFLKILLFAQVTFTCIIMCSVTTLEVQPNLNAHT